MGDLCYFENGDRGKNYPGRKATTETGIPFINAGHLDCGDIDWEEMDFIPDAHFRKLNSGKIQRGDILYCLRGSLGKFGIVDREIEGAIASSLIIVRPGPKVELNFLRYYFQSDISRGMIEALAGGAAQPNLSAKSLKAFEVPLPPVRDQKRIVAVLDQAFAALDRARADAAANRADARLLFESTVDGLICRNRHDWEEGTFEQLVGDVFTGPFGSLLHKSDYIEGGTPIVNPSNILDGRIEPDWTKTISNEAVARLTSYKLRVGDLVVGRRGEMGRCAPVLEHMEGWLCGTGSFVIRPKPGVSSEFVACVVRTPTMVEKLTSISTGATMPNLSNRTLAQMPFALPSHEEQLDMLEAINRLEVRSKALHSGFDLKVNELTNLRQSLLQKAFFGQLT